MDSDDSDNDRGALHDVAMYLGFRDSGEYLDTLAALGEDILDTKKREKYQRRFR